MITIMLWFWLVGFWVSVVPVKTTETTGQPSLTVTSLNSDNIFWIGPSHANPQNILRVEVVVPPPLVNHIHICVHHNTHSDLCALPENFHYPLHLLSKEGFGTFVLQVSIKSLLHDRQKVALTQSITLHVADARYLYPDPRATSTGLALQYPTNNSKSSTGILRIEPTITHGWPIYGSICIYIKRSDDGDAAFHQICTTSSMRQFNTEPLDHGSYLLYVAVLDQRGQLLKATTPIHVTVLNAKQVTEDYHIWYHSQLGMPGQPHPRWLGVPVQKSLNDLWVFQEIMYEYKPALYIEFGTLNGGSALYMSHVLSLVHAGAGTDYQILTVDIDASKIHATVLHDPRIEIFTASSISLATEEQIQRSIQAARPSSIMVSLDSQHDMRHVLQEMMVVSKYLQRGDYLIVEDTQHNGHPIAFSDDNGDGTTDGPYEAVVEFDRLHPGFFKHDLEREDRFGWTWNPHGYLVKT